MDVEMVMVMVMRRWLEHRLVLCAWRPPWLLRSACAWGRLVRVSG